MKMADKKQIDTGGIMPAGDVFDQFALEYQERFMNVDLYSDTLDAFCKLLHPNAKVLEVACGPGNITQYLLQQRPDLDILGTDIAPQMLALAKANNPQATFDLLDCTHISTLHRHFDVVVCGFGLPYLSYTEAEEFIKDASSLLNVGGAIYISTMEGSHNLSGIKQSSKGDKVIMTYYEEYYLCNQLVKNDFAIVGTYRKSYKGGDGTAVVDLIIIAVKQALATFI